MIREREMIDFVITTHQPIEFSVLCVVLGYNYSNPSPSSTVPLDHMLEAASNKYNILDWILNNH